MALRAHLTGRVGWARSFHHRDYRLLWGATLIHYMGVGMEQMALGWLVFEITDSPFMVGVAASANMAPFFLFGVLSGAVADRADRRVVIRLISLCSAITAALMALILLTSELADITVWYPIALAFAMGSVWAFSQTFRHAYTYDIVGRELALNGLSLTGSAQMAGQIGGALLAGVLIEAVGPGVQYLAACGAYLLALSVLLWTRPSGRADLARAEPVLQQMLGYVRLVRGNRTLLALMCFTALVEIFGFTHQSLLPVFAKENLGVGAVGLGVMTAVRRGGGVLGLVLLASSGDYRRKGALLLVCVTAFGAGLMAFSLAGGIVAFLIVLAFVNGCATIVDVLHKMLMQSNVSEGQRGRAMGSWVLSIGVAPVGHMGVGAMAGALGAPGALLINGSVLALVGLSTALGLPRIRRLE